MGIEDVLSCEESFRYQMLDRHKMDCNYFLGWGNRQLSRLWAGNVIDHIQNMKDLYNSFPYDKKPEWLTYEQILQYEKEMLTPTYDLFTCCSCHTHAVGILQKDTIGKFFYCSYCGKRNFLTTKKKNTMKAELITINKI